MELQERWSKWFRYFIFGVICLVTLLVFILSAKVCIVVSLNSNWIIAIFVFIIMLELYVNVIMNWFIKVLKNIDINESDIF